MEPPVDAGTDAGVTPPPPGPEITAAESYGAFVPSPARAILPGTDVTIIGVQAMLMDPTYLGRTKIEGSYDGWLNPGLLMLDTETGTVRHYTKDDGLPSMFYEDEFGSLGTYTTSFFDLAWIEKDKSFVAAAWSYVVKGTFDGTEWKFTATRLRQVGTTDFALVAHVAVAGNEIYVGTDQGVAVLNPATLVPKHWVDLGVSLAGPWVAGLSAGSVDGKDAVGIVFGATGMAPSHVGLVNVGETNATLFSFADGAKPLSVKGMQQAMLVGAVLPDGRGVIHAIQRSLNGMAMDVMVTAESLAMSSKGSIRPGVMVWDATLERLIVGAEAIPGSSGGIVALAGSADGNIWGAAEDLIPTDDPYASMLPWFPDAMAVDDKGALYVSGQQLCSEHKRRQLPVYRLERDAFSNPRLVRPWISGVRDIELDPVNGDTWLALRDGPSGMQCDAIPVGQSVCRVRADGACEVIPATTNDGSLILTAPGVVDLAFGDVSTRELAFATLDEATWVRRMDSARAVSTQIDPKVSLDMTAAAFGAVGELWLGSQQDWGYYPDLDEVAINKRGPHGLGFLTLDDQTGVTLARRYVRAKSDLGIEEVEGMPSDTVWAVMPLPGSSTALVALGVERSVTSYDHLLGEPAPSNARGGIALVNGKSVTSFAAPAGLTFSDVVGLAKGKDGAIFAVDSELGVLRIDLEQASTTVWAKPAWVAPERALSIAADESGRIAVGTTRALYVFGADTGVTPHFQNGARGYVWDVRFIADGSLMVGTDQGLSRVAIQGATLPATLGPASYSERELWPLPPPCGGVDGCVCKENANCSDGYECMCDLSGSCACAQLDPCAKDPGGANCVCQAGSMTCNTGLYCECIGTDCACKVDPATCANNACACTDNPDCPTSWYCNQGAGTCAERQACDSNCSCSTTSGCSPGLVCQGGIAGFSCI